MALVLFRSIHRGFFWSDFPLSLKESIIGFYLIQKIVYFKSPVLHLLDFLTMKIKIKKKLNIFKKIGDLFEHLKKCCTLLYMKLIFYHLSSNINKYVGGPIST